MNLESHNLVGKAIKLIQEGKEDDALVTFQESINVLEEDRKEKENVQESRNCLSRILYAITRKTK